VLKRSETAILASELVRNLYLNPLDDIPTLKAHPKTLLDPKSGKKKKPRTKVLRQKQKLRMGLPLPVPHNRLNLSEVV